MCCPLDSVVANVMGRNEIKSVKPFTHLRGGRGSQFGHRCRGCDCLGDPTVTRKRTSTLGDTGSSQQFIFYPNLVNRNNNSVWQKWYSNNSPTKCRFTTKEFRSYMLCFSLSVCFVTMRLGVEEDDQETLELMLDTIAEKGLMNRF